MLSSCCRYMRDEEYFNCPLCYKEFEGPKILPCCGESICRTCSEQDTTICLFCMEPVNHRTLKDNVTLRNFLESKKSTIVKCSKCEQDIEKKHVYNCETCEIKNGICPHCVIHSHPGHVVTIGISDVVFRLKSPFISKDLSEKEVKDKLDKIKHYISAIRQVRDIAKTIEEQDRMDVDDSEQNGNGAGGIS
uniref:B box-type domain-containing protein n=1 Tax=Steinernema glaseri TaxID=37863 RepID=A0A1I7YB73_9BILA